MYVNPHQQTLDVQRAWTRPPAWLVVDMEASLLVLRRALREIDPAVNAERLARRRALLTTPTHPLGPAAYRLPGIIKRARGHATEARLRTMELFVAEVRAAKAPNGRPPLAQQERIWSLRTSVNDHWRRCAFAALRWLLS